MTGRPSKELRDAIQNLEVFASATETPALVSAEALELQQGKLIAVKLGTLKKTVSLTRKFLETAFPIFRQLPREDILQALLQSGEVVKKHAVLLHIWENGSEEQRRFAAHAKESIDRFNKVVERSQRPCQSAKSLLRYFFDYPRRIFGTLKKIEITPLATLNICFAQHSSSQYNPLKMTGKVGGAPSSLSKKVGQLRSSFLPVQAQELFLMKAISLLEKHGIASHDEARLMVRAGQIHTGVEKKGIRTLSMMLEPYPGRCIEIQGSFMGRIPLSDSFQVCLTNQA
jgi:hypothetical protein